MSVTFRDAGRDIRDPMPSVSINEGNDTREKLRSTVKPSHRILCSLNPCLCIERDMLYMRDHDVAKVSEYA